MPFREFLGWHQILRARHIRKRNADARAQYEQQLAEMKKAEAGESQAGTARTSRVRTAL